MGKREADTKNKVAIKLKIAQSHIHYMIGCCREDNCRCVEILHQSRKAQKLIHVSQRLLLNCYLHSCAARFKNTGEYTVLSDEFMKVFHQVSRFI